MEKVPGIGKFPEPFYALAKGMFQFLLSLILRWKESLLLVEELFEGNKCDRVFLLLKI